MIVWEGSVTVADEQGKKTVVQGGQAFSWPDNTIGDISPDLSPLGEDVPYADLPLDDTTPAYYGDWPAAFQQDSLPDGWLWSDPGHDVTWTSPEPGVLEVRVGDGNDLWWYAFDAPLLLRKVTGDFDLQGQVQLTSQGKDLAITDFVLYAPGAALGALAKQFPWEGPIIDVYFLGGGLYAWHGRDQVATMGCRVDISDNKCAPAPDGPIWLRLTRRGDVWRTYRSLDGEQWVLTGMQDVHAPETLWVGWVFKRKANDGQVDAPAVTTLQDVTLVNAPLGAMRTDGWETAESAGVTVSNDVVALHIPAGEPIRPAAVEGQWARRLEGDFDAVVRVAPSAWQGKPGETRSFGFAAADIGDQNRVHVYFSELVYSESDVRRFYTSDIKIGGSWRSGQKVPTTDTEPSYLRLTRVDGRVTASYWSGCQWHSLEPYGDDFPEPVFLHPGIHNAWDATVPAGVDAEFKLVYLAEGPVVRDLPAWEPASCGVQAAPPAAASPTVPLPTAAPPTAVPPTATPSSPTSSGTAQLTLQNDSGISVCLIYISPAESDSWGDNWLAENEVIPSGSRRAFQMPEGSYDLLARDCDGNPVAYRIEVRLTGRMTWILNPLQRAPVQVVNNSGREICYLYISPADSETWGPDWLWKQTIPAGSTRTFQVPVGTYDLRADDCKHNTLKTQLGIGVGADGITWTISP